MKHPRVDEWTAGIERSLTSDIRVSATGIWRQDKNIQASVYPDARWNPTTVTNGLTGSPLGVYNWANRSASETTPLLTNVDGFTYRDPSGNALGTARAERKYTGAMFVLDKRFTNRWQGRISYVWSKAEGSRQQHRLEHLRPVERVRDAHARAGEQLRQAGQRPHRTRSRCTPRGRSPRSRSA